MDWKVDGAVTAGALALWLGGTVAEGELAPARCRWCEVPTLDARVRDAVVWGRPAVAQRASDVLLVALPAGVALQRGLSAGGVAAALPDLLLLAESLAVAGAAAQGAKLAFARARPSAVHATAPSGEVDDRLSFYSGHTTLTFAAASAGGMLSHLRGDPAAPWVLGVGLGAAATTGYLRLAGDRHWLTDALAGAVTGTAAGLVIPWLHRARAAPRSLRVLPAPGGLVLAGVY